MMPIPLRALSAIATALVLAILASSCASSPSAPRDGATWLRLHQRQGLSLRGIAVVDRMTVWASGSGGTVLRTTDGGETWNDVAPPGTARCDFRDVHVFDAQTALLMVAGQPARVYRTGDGGSSWQIVYEDSRKEAFFDTIAFSGDRGFLFGDPVDGAFYVARSDDRGGSWRRVEGTRLPAPVGSEAGFAASGTCLCVDGERVWIGTGGESSRCLSSRDGGESWDAQLMPMLQGRPSQGVFGLAFRGANGVAVGGDYRAAERSDGSAAWTADHGRTWHRAENGAGGYRSAAVWLDDRRVLAVGPAASSLSLDGGRSWQPLGDRGFHALGRAADGSVFAAGSDGRIALLVEQAAPEFSVMALFSDHMVLPRAERVVVRGSGPPAADVRLSASWGPESLVRIDADGRWRCPIETPAHGGPYRLELQCGSDSIEIEDVLIGDVWLASGQSNMEMPVGPHGGWRQGVADWEVETAGADHPTLRMFSVERATGSAPRDDVRGQWLVCSPETVGEFSATAYFFARELLQRGKGPIGVVHSSWGGTLCEAWTRGEALGGFPEFAEPLARAREEQGTRQRRRQQFWNAVPAAPTGTAWEQRTLPDKWSEAGLAEFDGVAFYRREVELPRELRGVELELRLGPIDDMDTIWCNAERVGGTEGGGAWSTPRRYAIPAALTEGRDRLRLLVRVVDTGGEGGITGAGEDMQLVRADGAGAAVSLAGAWARQRSASMSALPAWPRGGGGSANRPAALWNAMIAPLVPFPFTGVIWYQGEANRKRAGQYERLFPVMIRDWRHCFERTLPFHFVQIAPFAYKRDSDDQVAGLRMAQGEALALPRTGMVVTLDIGDPQDIHPRNKQEVGRRLALQALRDPYGEDVLADGPTPSVVTREGGTLRIKFAGAKGGLVAELPVTGFEVAGRDGTFVPAVARLDGDVVVVEATTVPAPKTVRYAWARAPQVTLRSTLGLPAAPFVRGLDR